MSEDDFGPACIDCGHPALMHTTTKCGHFVQAAYVHCNCSGYHHPDRPPGDGKPNHSAPSHTTGTFDEAGYTAGQGVFGFQQH